MRQVVVTGGGTGIGKAIAHAFATAGDAVVITGRRPEPLAATADDLGSSVRAVRFDAADPAQVQQALGELPGTVDVLVNNAGGNTSIGAPEPVSLADVAAAWQANLDSNLLSAVLVTTALRDRLVPGGAVVNFSSVGAHRGQAGSYAAAKAGIEAWTNHTLAAELGADQITANVVAPGYIESTEFFRGPDDRAAPRLPDRRDQERAAGNAGRHRRHRAVSRLPCRKSHHRPDHPCQRRRAQPLNAGRGAAVRGPG
jgi:3-oxoacyl-[acyl-carrier protein] reductase